MTPASHQVTGHRTGTLQLRLDDIQGVGQDRGQSSSRAATKQTVKLRKYTEIRCSVSKLPTLKRLVP